MPKRTISLSLALVAALLAIAMHGGVAYAEPGDRAPMISVALQTESIELPFSFSGLRRGVFHPGVHLGVEWPAWSSTNWQVLWGAQAGYYHHADLQHGLYLVPTLAGEVRPVGGLIGRADLGAGALHTWSSPDSFDLQDDGTYEPSTDWGRVRFMPQASVGSGWAFDAPERLPLEVFVRYTVFFEMPFSPPNDIPAMFHTLTQVGVRFGWPGTAGTK